jgi:putative SOS response-associated peptidase YedK
MARSGEPLRGAVQQFQRIQQDRRRRYLVRARRDPPLACFAGIWTNWTSVRKVKEGETTNDLYAFLTTEPNAEVGAIHPKAMPVILTTPDEVETWMTASPDEALTLQRPLPEGALKIVARGINSANLSAILYCSHSTADMPRLNLL